MDVTNDLEVDEPKRTKRWVVAITMVVVGIAALGFWAISSPDAVAYYKTPSELGDVPATDRVRVGGRLVDGSLDRSGSIVRFSITDGKRDVLVRYDGEVPDTLKDGTDVIAEGRVSADGLEADRVLAKCSSKYVPKDSPEHLGRT